MSGAIAEALVSTDRLMTWADLALRWRIQAPNQKALQQALYRRCRDWGLQPMRGTRGDQAVFRPADVLKAEDRAARG